MLLTIDVDDSDCMAIEDVMDQIAISQGWEGKGAVEGTESLFRITLPDGRDATYDVINDAIELPDGTCGSLFNDFCGKEWYCGESLLEFLDVTTAIWGQDAEGYYFLYTEC